MDVGVFLTVMAAAALHAGWNAVLKIRLDPFLAVVLVNVGCGAIALPIALWFGPPPLAAAGWAVLSVMVHLVYYLTLTGAYRRADMGQVYPVARGSAPLMTTAFSAFVLGEPIGVAGLAGVAVLAAGIMAMARPSGGGAFDRKALVLAFACGTSITVYTVIDGIGARAAGSPHLYSAWLFALDGLVVVAYALIRLKPAGLKPALGFVGPGLAGGVMSLAAYWIVIWAMTKAPIGLVAAVRETSVLFGAAIAVVVLREPLRWNRVLGACLILAGLVLMRL